MTLTVVPSHLSGSVPRIRLDVDSSAAAPLPVANGSSVAVYRVHADGTRYPVIMPVGARLGSGTWNGFDYHAPFHRAVRYVAVAGGQESALSAPIHLLSNAVWLIHSSDPTLSIRVDAVVSIGDRQRKSNAAQIEVFDKPTRFITGSRRRGVTGSITIRITPENEQAVMDLLADDTVILINAPADQPGWDIKWLWVQPGDETYSNPGEVIYYPYRHVQFDITGTEQPAVDLSSPWNYGTIDAAYVSYRAINASYANYQNLAQDVRS